MPEPEENEEKPGRVTEKPKVDLKKEEISEEILKETEVTDVSEKEDQPEKIEESKIEISEEISSRETISKEEDIEKKDSKSSNVYQIEEDE